MGSSGLESGTLSVRNLDRLELRRLPTRNILLVTILPNLVSRNIQIIILRVGPGRCPRLLPQWGAKVMDQCNHRDSESNYDSPLDGKGGCITIVIHPGVDEELHGSYQLMNRSKILNV